MGAKAMKLKTWQTVYHNVESALWALLLSSVIYFFAFVAAKLPEMGARAERTRAQEVAAENAYYCERMGMGTGTQKYSQCLLDLGEFRLKVEKRITDESDF
jgi:hypothetical protein